jgi:hypothetical protein
MDWWIARRRIDFTFNNQGSVPVSEGVGITQLDPKMPAYRAYIVGLHGLCIRAVEIDCLDDDAAIECAKHLIDGRDVELWQMDRPIARFDFASKRIIRK